MGDADYLYVFHNIVMPIAMEYAPELVFGEIILQYQRTYSLISPAVSAGFDAADGDDLGECHVTPAGYAHMTNMLCSLASGRVVVGLEVFGISHLLGISPRDHIQGGYNLESISNSALAVTKALLGDPLPPLPPLSPSEAALKTVWEVGMAQSRYWNCMGPRVPVPRKGKPPPLSRTIKLTSDASRYHRVDIPTGRCVPLGVSDYLLSS